MESGWRCWSILNCSADWILHRRSVLKETSSNPRSGREGTYKEVRNGDFATHDSIFVRLNVLFPPPFCFFNGLSINSFKHQCVFLIPKILDIFHKGTNKLRPKLLSCCWLSTCIQFCLRTKTVVKILYFFTLFLRSKNVMWRPRPSLCPTTY